MSEAQIRVGIGGWTYPPWRGLFYPDKLPQSKELDYASRQFGAIEINATFYGRQSPKSWAAWAKAAPDGFQFAVKGSRYVVTRPKLADAGEGLGVYFAQGMAALGDKLGPILWQFAPTKKFDPDDFEAFLKLLPEKQDGVALRHAVEVRNDSFMVPEFSTLARKYKVAIVYADHAKYPDIADITGDFIYARLQTGSDDNADCYTPKGLDEWAARARTWAEGKQPVDLRRADPKTDAPVQPRDVFVYFITEGKVRAPFGAMALMKRVAD